MAEGREEGGGWEVEEDGGRVRSIKKCTNN